MYLPSPGDGALRQGEVLTNVLRMRVAMASVGAAVEEAVGFLGFEHRYAVVMSQDCDLAQELASRNAAGDGQAAGEWHAAPDTQAITEVLLCPAQEAAQVRAVWRRGSKFWESARTNRDQRYHFLAPVPAESDAAGGGLDDYLVIDFKQFFSIPPEELYLRIGLPDGHDQRVRRRWYMEPPYRDHLTSRFLSFIGRIALPEALEDPGYA